MLITLNGIPVISISSTLQSSSLLFSSSPFAGGYPPVEKFFIPPRPHPRRCLPLENISRTDKKVHNKAIKNLSVFLSDSKDALPPPELARLWKGIFYCFWMSDKPLIRQAVATELTELVLTITSTPAALSFLS
ncbi:nucleolar protein,Nop52-domain-containing protein [Desarmillaria tabescens]|uniref:Nucleolar protein,Nop52-domain-containing protein n=2 Tax=Armillaria tabescens TaxID=1929756 RepID=A0AA39NRE5_ARMTA|nr:nucleolar protein,Nop52-domain-containing protein [Desarmillaria tabescens]KAK0470448.1 nucleolar protein,Nop52-domain-containing protein [Desarmillaria tabescens]